MTDIKPKTQKLTKRDVTTIKCLASGYTDKETAIVLKVTHFRVSRIISDILHKTGSVNRPQLIDYAYKNGILKI